MICKFHSPKSWRHFQKRKPCVHKIRKLCCAALILEAAVLARDYEEAGIRVDRQEQQEKIFVEKGMEEEPGHIVEQYFGVHLRIKEGVLEFYRREEQHNHSESPVKKMP